MRKLSLLTSCGLVACTLDLAVPPTGFRAAIAAEVSVDFNVPRGGLGGVIAAIAASGRRPISFPSALAAGRDAGPIVGRKTVREALSEALAGTGLSVASTADGALTVRQTAGSDGAANGKATVATDIADIDVAGDATSRYRDNGFQAGDAGTTVRIGDAPAKEIPLTVSTVTNDVLKSQALTTAVDAVQNVPGVSLTSSSDGLTSTFTIRGFKQIGVSIDGNPGGVAAQVPIDDVERVEVLKGPTSILTGTSSPGAVNIATKQPTDETIRTLTARYGSFGYKTLALDLGGRVPQTDNLTYRFNLSGNIADKDYGGYLDPHEVLISPSLRWQDKDTSVLLGVRYANLNVGNTTYTFFNRATNTLVPLPRGVAEVNPFLASFLSKTTFYSTQTHDFGNILGLDTLFENNAYYDIQHLTNPGFSWTGRISTQGQYGYNQITDGDGVYQFNERPSITLKRDFGFMQSLNKFGFDYISSVLSLRENFGDTSFVNPFSGMPYQGILPIGPIGQDPNVTGLVQDVSDSGFYYVNKTDLFDNRLHIFGTVRQDTFRSRFDTAPYDATQHSQSSQSDVSWVGGGAFDVAPWFTVYGNRNVGFLQQTGINSATGSTLPPGGFDQSEVGQRYFLFDKKLTLSTSFYTLAQTNVGIADPNDPSGLTSVLVPGEDTRGFEFEAQARSRPASMSSQASLACIRPISASKPARRCSEIPPRRQACGRPTRSRTAR